MASKSGNPHPPWVSPQNINLKNIKCVKSIPPEGTKFYILYLGNSEPPHRIQKYTDDDGNQHSLNEPLILEGVVPVGVPGTQVIRTRSRTGLVLTLNITKCKENPSLVGKYIVFNSNRDQISLTPFKGGPRMIKLAKKRFLLTKLREGAEQHQSLHYFPGLKDTNNELIPGTEGRHTVRLRGRDEGSDPAYLGSEYDHDEHQLNNIMYFQEEKPQRDGYMLPPNPESGAKRARTGGKKKKRKRRKTRRKTRRRKSKRRKRTRKKRRRR